MRRIVMWFLSTLTVVVLMFGYHTSTSGALSQAGDVVVPATPTPGSGSGSTTSTTGGSGTTSGSTGSGTTKKKSATAKTYTGPTVQTQWGPVQVQLTVKSGTITDVAVLQYPQGNPRDEQINAEALPILITATKEQQSAKIDMVSGATVTSTGYLQSLQGALDSAGL